MDLFLTWCDETLLILIHPKKYEVIIMMYWYIGEVLVYVINKGMLICDTHKT